MNTIAPPRTTWFSWSVLVGIAIGGACMWRTGLLSAFASAAGLLVLAVSDFRTRRIPRQVVAAAAAATFGLADAVAHGAGARLVSAALITVAVALIAGAIWATTSGIGFGDVKLLTLAAFVPAWLRGTAVLTMVLVALIAALGMVGVERLRARALTMKSSIAFGPPLLVGWLVGVLSA